MSSTGHQLRALYVPERLTYGGGAPHQEISNFPRGRPFKEAYHGTVKTFISNSDNQTTQYEISRLHELLRQVDAVTLLL